MRRGLLLGIGILETLVACVLFGVGWQLPRPEAVDQSVQRVGVVTRSAQEQVQLMRRQVDDVRRKEFPKVAGQVRIQSRAVSANLRTRAIDFDAIEAMSDSLTTVAQGLDGWSDALDGGMNLARLRGPVAPADSPEAPVSASALQTAATLDAAADALDGDVGRALGAIARSPLTGPADLLVALQGGVANEGRVESSVRADRFEATRENLRELEASLASAAPQVEALGTAVYPVVTPSPGGAPSVELRPVWPEGRRAAEGLRNAHAGVRSLNREIDYFSGRTPGVPSLGSALASARHTREMAAGLRKTRKGLDQAFRAWPEFAATMHRSASVLNGSRSQLDHVLTRRTQYERAVQSSERLTQTTDELIETYSGRFDTRLREQEQALGRMERGLGEVNDALPTVGKTANDMFGAVRWMFWLVGALIAIHGVFVGVEAMLKNETARGTTAAGGS